MGTRGCENVDKSLDFIYSLVNVCCLSDVGHRILAVFPEVVVGSWVLSRSSVRGSSCNR